MISISNPDPELKWISYATGMSTTGLSVIIMMALMMNITKILMILAIRAESACVRQVLRSGWKAGSRLDKALCSWVHLLDKAVQSLPDIANGVLLCLKDSFFSQSQCRAPWAVCILQWHEVNTALCKNVRECKLECACVLVFLYVCIKNCVSVCNCAIACIEHRGRVSVCVQVGGRRLDSTGSRSLVG